MHQQMTMGVPAEKEEEGGSLNEVQIDGHSAIHSQGEGKMKLDEIQADIPRQHYWGSIECMRGDID